MKDPMNKKIGISAILIFFSLMSAMIGSAEVQSAEKWTHICTDPKLPQTCRIEQKLFVNQGGEGQEKQMGQILNVAVLYSGINDRKPYIVMQLPLGVDLRAGMVLKVDDAKEMKAPFLKCTKAGCEIQSVLTDDLLAQLKRGNFMKVGFRAFGAKKTMVVNADLSGFTKAFSKLF